MKTFVAALLLTISISAPASAYYRLTCREVGTGKVVLFDSLAFPKCEVITNGFCKGDMWTDALRAPGIKQQLGPNDPYRDRHEPIFQVGFVLRSQVHSAYGAFLGHLRMETLSVTSEPHQPVRATARIELEYRGRSDKTVNESYETICTSTFYHKD